MWTCVLISLGPRSGIAGSYHHCIWPFKELPDCFPKWLHHFTFLPAVYESSNFFTSSPALIIFLIKFYFIVVILMGEVVSCFDLHFLLHLLLWVCWPFIYILWRNVCSDPLPIFNNWVVKVIYMFYIQIPYQIMICKYFFLLSCNALGSIEVLNFGEV